MPKQHPHCIALVKCLKANEVVVCEKDFSLPCKELVDKFEAFLIDAITVVGKIKRQDLRIACRAVCRDVSREEADRFAQLMLQCVSCLC